MKIKFTDKILPLVCLVMTTAFIVCVFFLVKANKTAPDSFFTGSNEGFILASSQILWDGNGLKITDGLVRDDAFLLNCQDAATPKTFGCQHSQDDYQIIKIVDQNNETTFLTLEGDVMAHIDAVEASSASISITDSLGRTVVSYKLDRNTHLLSVVE